jgi:hypothetical protein
VVDGGGLENRCTGNRIGGSNPSPSANSLQVTADQSLAADFCIQNHNASRAARRQWRGRDWVTTCAAQAEIHPLLQAALDALP